MSESAEQERKKHLDVDKLLVDIEILEDLANIGRQYITFLEGQAQRELRGDEIVLQERYRVALARWYNEIFRIDKPWRKFQERRRGKTRPLKLGGFTYRQHRPMKP